MKTYSAIEMLAYLNGKMNRQDAHALERAALDDDFLADAIEGYRLMQTTMTDELILQKAKTIIPEARLKIPEKAKVVSFSHYRWIGYATAAFLLLGAGWWIFSISKPDAILPAELQQTVENSKTIESAHSDTNGFDERVVSTPVPENTIEKKAAIEKITDSEPEKSIVSIPKNKKTSGMTSIADNAISAKSTAIQSDQMDTIQPTSIQAESSNISSRKMVSAMAKSEPTSLLTFSLSDSAQASPVGGWDAYNNYLIASIADITQNKKGKAILEISASGGIEKVEIEGPYAEKDKIFIRSMIEKGPLWNNKTQKPVKTTIQFH